MVSFAFPNSNTAMFQRGASLIGLLIGLVISMVVVLGMLNVYKNTIRTTLSSNEDSSTDSTRLSSMISAQIQLQGAGYGINAAAVGTDFVLLSGATMTAVAGSNPTTFRLSGTSVAVASTAVVGNALVWGFRLTDASPYQCSGLWAPEPSASPTSTPVSGLRRLGPVPCASAATWAALDWGVLTLDQSPRTVISFTVTPVVTPGCMAFGMSGKGAIQVALSATSTRLNYAIDGAAPTTASSPSSTATTCLLNFPAS